MKLLAASIAFLVLSNIAFADASKPLSDFFIRTQLVGSWSQIIVASEPAIKQMDLAFQADGTFKSFAVFVGRTSELQMNVEGKWKIEKGALVEEITKSSVPKAVSIGAISKDLVTGLKGGIITFRSGSSGKVFQMRKK